MRNHSQSSNHQTTPSNESARLLYESISDLKLTEFVTRENLQQASAEQLDGLLSRMIVLPNLRTQFVDSCLHLWFEREDQRGEFRLRLLHAFGSQASRQAFSDPSLMSSNIEAFTDIFCRICHDSELLKPEAEVKELILLARFFVKCAISLNDRTLLDWDIRGYKAVLTALELNLRIIPQETRTETKDLGSIFDFVKERLEFSPEPTMESVKVLETLWSIGTLIAPQSFASALATSTKTLLHQIDRAAETLIRNGYTEISRQESELSIAIDDLLYRGLEKLRSQLDANQLDNRLADDVWLKVLERYPINSREVLISLPALLRTDPLAAEPHLKKILSSSSKQKKTYRTALIEILNVDEGPQEIRRLLNKMKPAKRLACFDNLDRYLAEIEIELSDRDYSQDWLGKYALALSELKKLLGHPV